MATWGCGLATFGARSAFVSGLGLLSLSPVMLPAAAAVTRLSLATGGHCFATRAAKKQKSHQRALGLRGPAGRAVAKALQIAPPPSLTRRAADHYMMSLQANDGDRAKAIVAAADSQARGTVALSSEEKTALLHKYLPEESDVSKKLRKHSHKWLWRFLMKKDWDKLDACLEELQKQNVDFDEVTYNLAIFGALLNPNCEDELAKELVAQMAEDGRFHIALVRHQAAFIESYFELKEVDAAPNRNNLLKVAKTVWHTAVNFKKRRIKETRAKLAHAAGEQRGRVLAAGEAAGVNAPGFPSSVPLRIDAGTGSPHPEARRTREVKDVMCDGLKAGGTPRQTVRRRPLFLKGIHKGCGKPRQSMHRWKH